MADRMTENIKMPATLWGNCLAGEESSNPSDASKGKTGSKEDIVELNLLKKIMGNYHPTEGSKTYREIMDDNRKLRSEVQTVSEKLRSLSSECEEMKNRIEISEQETISLRQLKFPSIQENDSKKKKTGKLLHHKSHKKQDIQQLSEEEKKQRLKQHLLRFHRHYTDPQIIFLGKVLNEDRLPADDMARLFDPLMNSLRMEQFYLLLCNEHKIPVQTGVPETAETSGIMETAVTADSDDDHSSSPVIRLEPEPPGHQQQKEVYMRYAGMVSTKRIR